MRTFTNQEIEIGQRYVYLKNERTGSSTTRKLKMVGTCTEIGKNCIYFRREKLSENTYWDKTCGGIKEVIDMRNVLLDIMNISR